MCISYCAKTETNSLLVNGQAVRLCLCSSRPSPHTVKWLNSHWRVKKKEKRLRCDRI